MSFAISIPAIYCYVRAEYLYNLESHQNEVVPCMVFGADSVYGRALGMDCVLDNGASFTRLPISAFVHKTDAPDIPLDYLCLWNNFSYSFEVVEYTALRGADCEVILKDKKWYPGEYMYTFSWFGNSFSENPGEGGFKRAHLIKLENGCFTLQPNNRMRWFDQAFITKPFPDKPDYKTNEQVWSVENSITEDSDKYFYDINCSRHKERTITCNGCHSMPQTLAWNRHVMCVSCGRCEYLGCTNYI